MECIRPAVEQKALYSAIVDLEDRQVSVIASINQVFISRVDIVGSVLTSQKYIRERLLRLIETSGGNGITVGSLV